MIPIRDEHLAPRVRFPYVNLFFFITCIVVFLYEFTLSQNALQVLVYSFGVVPVEILTGVDNAPLTPGPVWLTLITAMFLHGGWLHLLGNMLYLFIFGDNVEDAFGHIGYFFFYLIAGIVASFAQIFIEPSSTIPSVGASGAIAGVLGAYLVLYPAARVKTVIFFGFFFTITTLPAILVIGVWGISQFFTGVMSLNVETATTGGVAYFAHIGGFVFGLLVGLLARGFMKRDGSPRF